jgi:hypothetical protein
MDGAQLDGMEENVTRSKCLLKSDFPFVSFAISFLRTDDNDVGQTLKWSWKQKVLQRGRRCLDMVQEKMGFFYKLFIEL